MDEKPNDIMKPNVEDEDPNICRDYQRGVCNRGNKCKFVHPTNVKPPDNEKPPICRDYQNGTCDRNNCKYLHITTQEERLFLATGKLPATAGTSSNAINPPRRVAGMDVCKDFLNNVCNRGSRCKFRHISESEWESEKRHVPSMEDDITRKRKRESFGGTSLDYQFLSDENDMLRRKVADLQRQVADLRAMNDTLYEQNMRYRSQLKSELASGESRGGAVSYPGYPRGRDEAARYIRDSYDSASTVYPDRATAGQGITYSPATFSKDSAFDGYTSFTR